MRNPGISPDRLDPTGWLCLAETTSDIAGTAGLGDAGVRGSMDYRSLAERASGGHAEGDAAAAVGSVGAGPGCVAYCV